MIDRQQARFATSRRIGRITASIVAMALLGLWGLQWAIDRRVRATLIERFGYDYAIIAAHVDGEPGIGFKMLTKVPQLIMRSLFPPVPEGSGGFTGLRHHMVLLVSDNRWVYLQPWSFRSFNLEPDTHPRQIAAMQPSLRDKYMFKESDIRLVRGLRVKGIKPGPDISFYRGGEGISPAEGSALFYSFCRPPYIPPDIIRDANPAQFLPDSTYGRASYGDRYDVEGVDGQSPMVGYRTGEQEWEYAYQYVGMTAGGIHVLRIQQYDDDGHVRNRRYCHFLFVTLELEKKLAPTMRSDDGPDSERQTFSDQIPVLRIHGRAYPRWGDCDGHFRVEGDRLIAAGRNDDGAPRWEVIADLTPDSTYGDLLGRSLLDCEGKPLDGDQSSRRRPLDRIDITEHQLAGRR